MDDGDYVEDEEDDLFNYLGSLTASVRLDIQRHFDGEPGAPPPPTPQTNRPPINSINRPGVKLASGPCSTATNNTNTNTNNSNNTISGTPPAPQNHATLRPTSMSAAMRLIEDDDLHRARAESLKQAREESFRAKEDTDLRLATLLSENESTARRMSELHDQLNSQKRALALTALKRSFCGCDEDLLEDVLEQANGDEATARGLLLSMKCGTERPQPVTHTTLKPQPVTCTPPNSSHVEKAKEPISKCLEPVTWNSLSNDVLHQDNLQRAKEKKESRDSHSLESRLDLHETHQTARRTEKDEWQDKMTTGPVKIAETYLQVDRENVNFYERDSQDTHEGEPLTPTLPHHDTGHQPLSLSAQLFGESVESQNTDTQPSSSSNSFKAPLSRTPLSPLHDPPPCLPLAPERDIPRTDPQQLPLPTSHNRSPSNAQLCGTKATQAPTTPLPHPPLSCVSRVPTLQNLQPVQEESFPVKNLPPNTYQLPQPPPPKFVTPPQTKPHPPPLNLPIPAAVNGYRFLPQQSPYPPIPHCPLPTPALVGLVGSNLRASKPPPTVTTPPQMPLPLVPQQPPILSANVPPKNTTLPCIQRKGPPVLPPTSPVVTAHRMPQVSPGLTSSIPSTGGYPHFIIIDSGSSTTRVGTNSCDYPSLRIKSILDPRNCVGSAGPRPARPTIWSHHIGEFCKCRSFNSESTGVIVTVPPHIDQDGGVNWIAQTVFEEYNMSSLSFLEESLLPLWALGTSNGLVLELGFGSTNIIPAIETPVPGKSLHWDFGGWDVTNFFINNFSRAVNLIFPTTPAFYQAFEFCKEKYFTLDPASIDPQQPCFALPDGKVLSLGNYHRTEPEWFYQQAEYANNIYHLLFDCHPVDQQKILSNVVLSGGTSLIPGFQERLRRDLQPCFPNIVVNVKAPPNRGDLVWIGASIASRQTEFSSRFAVSKSEYYARGPAVFRKCRI
ncbi:Actin alpha skeletal muscle [Pelomyxa schiedti]|nr:Actin alpha skeletal muscle [Pelomyxa schiedti]